MKATKPYRCNGYLRQLLLVGLLLRVLSRLGMRNLLRKTNMLLVVLLVTVFGCLLIRLVVLCLLKYVRFVLSVKLRTCLNVMMKFKRLSHVHGLVRFVICGLKQPLNQVSLKNVPITSSIGTKDVTLKLAKSANGSRLWLLLLTFL